MLGEVPPPHSKALAPLLTSRRIGATFRPVNAQRPIKGHGQSEDVRDEGAERRYPAFSGRISGGANHVLPRPQSDQKCSQVIEKAA